MLNPADLRKELKQFNLIYVTDKREGVMRQKIGNKFKYYGSQGKLVNNSKTLKRVSALAIPPAWENVWICPSPNGHLQATGYDERGRKQYLYHQIWIKMCQENKFEKMEFFGNVLPKIRRRVKLDMKLRGLPRKKVIAAIVWLLEKTFIRVGNDEYAKENNSFGLTTLRNKHVKVWGDNVKFEFVGKSGIEHIVDFRSPAIAKIIKRCIELPGYELFQYIDEEGEKQVIDSKDVNNYLKEITGEDITAKDFRTWGATLLCAIKLCKQTYPDDPKQVKKCINDVIKQTSQHLRNTPSVCRNYYIHPQVIKSFHENKLQHFFLRRGYRNNGLNRQEWAVLSLIGS